jgi:hypothetical protein
LLKKGKEGENVFKKNIIHFGIRSKKTEFYSVFKTVKEALIMFMQKKFRGVYIGNTPTSREGGRNRLV